MLLFPAKGLDSLGVMLAGKDYKVTLRKGRVTSHTWKDSIKFYEKKVASLKSKANILSEIHKIGFGDIFEKGWTFDLIMDIIKYIENSPAKDELNSTNILMAIMNKEVRAALLYDRPSKKGKTPRRVYNRLLSKEQQRTLRLTIGDKTIVYVPPSDVDSEFLRKCPKKAIDSSDE